MLLSGGLTPVEQWYQANPHQFHLVALGKMHAFPSPVPRRNQKPFKPAFFETLKQQHEAEDGVRDVQLWLQRVSAPPRMSTVNSSLMSCALNSLGVYLYLRGLRAISRWALAHWRAGERGGTLADHHLRITNL